MFRIELVDYESVVGFFEVDRTITLSSLASWVKEAVRLRKAHVIPSWMKEVVRANSGSVIAWQIRRPDNRILCQVKVQDA